MKKKILAILLMLVLVLVMVPVSASANDEDAETETEPVISSSEDTGVVDSDAIALAEGDFEWSDTGANRTAFDKVAIESIRVSGPATVIIPESEYSLMIGKTEVATAYAFAENDIETFVTFDVDSNPLMGDIALKEDFYNLELSLYDKVESAVSISSYNVDVPEYNITVNPETAVYTGTESIIYYWAVPVGLMYESVIFEINNMTLNEYIDYFTGSTTGDEDATLKFGINEKYLDTLTDGNYTITADYNNNNASMKMELEVRYSFKATYAVTFHGTGPATYYIAAPSKTFDSISVVNTQLTPAQLTPANYNIASASNANKKDAIGLTPINKNIVNSVVLGSQDSGELVPITYSLEHDEGIVHSNESNVTTLDNSEEIADTDITAIMLNESYLKTLDNGEYEFTALFEDGLANLTLVVDVPSAKTTNTPETSETPKTGDSAPVAIYGIILLAGLGSLVVAKRRLIK